MNIKVLFFGRLRKLADRQKTICMKEGSRLGGLIDCLVKELGSEFHQEVSHVEQLRILINGQEYELLDNMQTELKDGDTIVFLTLIAGG